MLKAILAWLAKNILTIIIEELRKEWLRDMNEKLAEEAVNKKVKEAVADVRKPLDPSKSVAEREKDEEDKFDRFRERLNH